MSLCVYVCVVVECMFTCMLGILEMCLCIYVGVFVQGTSTCKSGCFWQRAFVSMFVLLQTVCIHVRLEIFATSVCVYILVVGQGMYTCKTGHIGNEPLRLCFCFSRGFVYMYDWEFCKWPFVFMSVLLQKVCTHVRLGILASSVCVHVCVVVEGMYACRTGYLVIQPLCLCLCWCIGYVHI